MHKKLTAKQILGHRVRQERKERGWTQTQLSEMINKTTEMVCHIENGSATTKLKTIDRLAEIFDIEPYKLFKKKILLIWQKFLAFAWNCCKN